MSNKNANSKNSQLARREVSQTKTQLAATVEYHHMGPIPDPMTLQKYEQICPGAADRIISMAEKQSDHRQEIEKKVIKSKTRDSLLGIISGFIIAIVTILCGTFVIYNGYVWSGTFLGSAGLVGLVAVFIYGTRENQKERQQKQQRK